MTTRKTLVPFDRASPDRRIKGFLYPNVDTKPIASFLEIGTSRQWEAGMVVFVGREISKDDVFAKIVDSGKTISSVRELLDIIQEFLGQVNNFKIGDVIGIKPKGDGFELVKLAKPQKSKSKLPR